MDDKTLCNLNNRIIALCDGDGWSFDDQVEDCTSAVKATHADRCMFLCDNGRCDSHNAQDIAVKLK